MARIRIPIVLMALLGSGAPAAAASTTGSLGVGATVVPACTVSTETRSTAPDVTCTNLGGGEIAIRAAASSTSPTTVSSSPDPLRARDAARGEGVDYVTVTY